VGHRLASDARRAGDHAVHLTYGLERIAAFLQDVDSIYDITWVVDPDGRPVKYGEIRLKDELQFSVYNFERADVAKAWKHLELYEAECQALLNEYATLSESKRESELRAADSGEKRIAKSEDPTSGEEPKANSEERVLAARRFPVLGAFDLCLKCSHLFNILDARGAISVTERVGVIARIRALAVGVAKAYVDQQKAEAAPTLSPRKGDEDRAPGGKASAQLAATRS
jgi:glycyl-tRNA synthetase alpha chain